MEYYGIIWHCASQICFWRDFEEWQSGILFSWLRDPSKQEFCRIREFFTSPLSSGAEATGIHLGVCRWLDCAGLGVIWMAFHIFNVAWVLTDSVPCSSVADSSVTLGKSPFSLCLFPPAHHLLSLFTLQDFLGRELSLSVEHAWDSVQRKGFLTWDHLLSPP